MLYFRPRAAFLVALLMIFTTASAGTHAPPAAEPADEPGAPAWPAPRTRASNETPPPPPPTNNTTSSASFSPATRSVSGQAGSTVTFSVTLTYEGDAARPFDISITNTGGFNVSVAPRNVTLAPGESVELHGTIDAPGLVERFVGKAGTVHLFANGNSSASSGPSAMATIHACFRGLITSPCAAPTPPGNETNGTRGNESDAWV
jgi:hypothetical protein